MAALRKPIPQEEGFLESQAGQEWLAEAADDLLHRRNVEAPNPFGKATVLVSFNRLPEALADHMALRIDPGRCIEQILIALVRQNSDSDLHRLAVRAIGGPDVVKDLALQLVAAHADAYRDAAQESERVEREVGF